MTTTTDKLAAALRAVVAAADTSTPGGHWEARADAMDAAAETARAALAEYEAGKAAPAPAATGEHAPEPWRFDGRTQILAADNGDHGIIATMNRGRDFRGPECDANARRIVACVNACAGIPTAALEGATFGQDHGSVYELARDPQPKKDTP